MRIDTVHVQLAIADVVEPGPRHDRVSALHTLRDREVELIHTVHTVGLLSIRAGPRAGVRALRTFELFIEVHHGVGRTSALDAVYDEPVLGVLDSGRVGFVGDADLTRSAAVDRSVRAVAGVESEELRGAGCHWLAAR